MANYALLTFDNEVAREGHREEETTEGDKHDDDDDDDDDGEVQAWPWERQGDVGWLRVNIATRDGGDSLGRGEAILLGGGNDDCLAGEGGGVLRPGGGNGDTFRGGGAKGDNLGGGGDKKKDRGGRKAIMFESGMARGQQWERCGEREREKRGSVGIIVEIREEEELMLRLCKGWLPNNLSA
ncbi:uncharacterized protein LOC135631511 [Musa acuminata AAA Group]|uniref:uncharacterized protein LOC135631511 n=1 Tax=Musa acuminata AAA Group TaxID=214697 RepID=UPI0031E20ED1